MDACRFHSADGGDADGNRESDAQTMGGPDGTCGEQEAGPYGESCLDGGVYGVWCETDDQCGVDSICEEAVCRAGCRHDDACAEDEICEETLCRMGCREDSTCESGTYCSTDVLRCETGCRGLGGCPDQHWCDFSAGHTCLACLETGEPDGDPASAQRIDRGLSGEATVVMGTLCGYRDADHFLVDVATTSTFTTSGTRWSFVEVTIHTIDAPDSEAILQIETEEGGIARSYRMRVSDSRVVYSIATRYEVCLDHDCRRWNLPLALTTSSYGPIEYSVTVHSDIVNELPWSD